jgi:hypothetical protein
LSRWLVALAGCALLSSMAMADPTPLAPQPGEPTISPSGKFALATVSFANRRMAHMLILVNLRTNDLQRVKDYRRGVEVAWSPDNTHFLVNDYFASDESDCYIYDRDTLRATRLLTLLVAALPETKKFLQYDPHYLMCESWISNRALVVHFFGWGGDTPSGFDYLLRYDGARSFTIISKSFKYGAPYPRR